MDFTFEEQELMAIYNPGTRLGLIQALNEMRTYLDEDEQELRATPHKYQNPHYTIGAK